MPRRIQGEHEKAMRDSLPRHVPRDAPECHQFILDTTEQRMMYMAVQLDKVAAMPAETTQQRLARCSVFLGAIERCCHGTPLTDPELAAFESGHGRDR